MRMPLTEDARVVLAFLRDHPVSNPESMNRRLGFDEIRIRTALAHLMREKLVVSRSELQDKATYYPV